MAVTVIWKVFIVSRINFIGSFICKIYTFFYIYNKLHMKKLHVVGTCCYLAIIIHDTYIYQSQSKLTISLEVVGWLCYVIWTWLHDRWTKIKVYTWSWFSWKLGIYVCIPLVANICDKIVIFMGVVNS